jgi:hypothetical protein
VKMHTSHLPRSPFVRRVPMVGNGTLDRVQERCQLVGGDGGGGGGGGVLHHPRRR